MYFHTNFILLAEILIASYIIIKWVPYQTHNKYQLNLYLLKNVCRIGWLSEYNEASKGEREDRKEAQKQRKDSQKKKKK